MVEKPNKFQAAMLGGLLLGALSSIPGISAVNCLCCLWFVVGGVIAARTFIKRSPALPATTGDGAATGAMAGVIGSAINLVVGVPLGILTSNVTVGMYERMRDAVNDPNFRQVMDEAIRNAQTQSFGQQLAGAIFGWLILAAVGTAFATLGGILGVSLFEKRKGQQPPAGFTPPPTGTQPY